MTKQQSKGFPLIWIFVIAAVLLVAGVLTWAMGTSTRATVKVGPRLSVDKERIDFGRMPFEKQVRAEFKITNVGDNTLTLDASAPIQALEGC